ncbi:hypothetical protein FOXB_11869 [Fusarium oxysporum f. sp. conglutinans Fo5176]|uniref:Uncharacterized protein n=1 Tax=Fusarium oxysporum (strain Fo5176) TaxID=660025 RepID=F9FZN7_FUSOF|nr:hypothetical protein FOXB_11869 [Fusarium oxysporum f. sp. conglutinans Fo5176]KAI8409176.1 hypothetical protein FOFC_09008 [Fusarium oxysporum]
MDEDCLAVLHNIGHGERIVNPSRNREELHLSQSHVHVRRTSLIQDPMIDFNRLRHRIFDPSPSNVLILLDCCHAASGSMGQRHDLIAASRFVDADTHYEPQGFTENVVQQLEHAYNQGKILSTLNLYNRLATRHSLMKNGTPELAAMPIFPQHHGSHYLPIFVLPVRPDDNQSWHLAPSVGLRLQTVNVIFSVNLNSTDIQNWVLCKVGAAAAYME